MTNKDGGASRPLSFRLTERDTLIKTVFEEIANNIHKTKERVEIKDIIYHLCAVYVRHDPLTIPSQEMLLEQIRVMFEEYKVSTVFVQERDPNNYDDNEEADDEGIDDLLDIFGVDVK